MSSEGQILDDLYLGLESDIGLKANRQIEREEQLARLRKKEAKAATELALTSLLENLVLMDAQEREEQ